MGNNEMGMIRPELPNIVGLSHICIFVDDMEQAVDYYRHLLGVQPDHCLSHWKNQGFFKAGGFVDEAADGGCFDCVCQCAGYKAHAGTDAVPLSQGPHRAGDLCCERRQRRPPCGA